MHHIEIVGVARRVTECIGKRASVVAFASTLAVASLVSVAAQADRHCLPSQEAFYGARHVLLDEQTSCRDALEQAKEALRSASDHARVCGCEALVSDLEELNRELTSREASCEQKADRILGQTAHVRSLVAACQ